MRFTDILEATCRRAPIIIGATIFAAVAGARWNAPYWPFFTLAAVVFLLAAALWARRGAARQLKSTEQLGFARIRDWLWFESFANNRPRGYLALAWLSMFTPVATGMRVPYALLSFAALALTVAWGEDKRRFPAEMPDEE